MKRNVVIATMAAVALIVGGTATALTVSGDDGAPPQRSSVQVQDGNDRKDADAAAEADGNDPAGAGGADEADGIDGRTDGTNAPRSGDDADDQAEDAAEAKAAKVTAAEAITAALQHTSGTAVGAELDTERTNVVWEIDIMSSDGTWHSVQVDPGTGRVLGSRTEKEDPEDAARVHAALKGSSVSAAEAAQAAAAKGPVHSVELDDEGGAHAWDVDTTGADGVASDWNVDLNTAEVTDRPAEDADDSDD